MMAGHAIPWAKPDFWGSEAERVAEALASTWISGGPFVERLEEGIAALTGARHALAVANGTAAIHLAYLAAGLRAGDEVIVPGFAFQAAANIALHVGARPVFAEVDPETWCLDAATVERLLTPHTRAVVPVHTYGNVCAMAPLLDLARERDIMVIEDAAESLGSRLGGRMSGTLGAIGCYSFHATKTITTGEGGMVVTDDPALAERVALYRSHGMLRKRHYWHELPGHNFRLTNLQAALGCAQLEKLDLIVAARDRMYDAYRRRLAAMGGLTLQRLTTGVEPVIWAVAVRLDPAAFPQGRDAVMAEMAEAGVETRPGFCAPSEMAFYGCPPLPVCDDLARQVLSLPSFPTLTDGQIEFVCSTLNGLRR